MAQFGSYRPYFKILRNNEKKKQLEMWEKTFIPLCFIEINFNTFDLRKILSQENAKVALWEVNQKTLQSTIEILTKHAVCKPKHQTSWLNPTAKIWWSLAKLTSLFYVMYIINDFKFAYLILILSMIGT